MQMFRKPNGQFVLTTETESEYVRLMSIMDTAVLGSVRPRALARAIWRFMRCFRTV